MFTETGMFIIREQIGKNEHNNEQSMKSVKCKYCGQKDGVHKMGCETRKITVMADIAMCSGKGCGLKDKCYRYTAPKSQYMQSYFTIPPIDKDGKCELFWDNKQKKQL